MFFLILFWYCIIKEFFGIKGGYIVCIGGGNSLVINMVIDIIGGKYFWNVGLCCVVVSVIVNYNIVIFYF